MASSVVAALPSVASRLSISRRLRVKARRFLNSSVFSTFLSSAALATIFMSIRNASTLSFLVAGSICARLGPSSSSASATSLWRISAPLTLASTGLSSAREPAGRRPEPRPGSRQRPGRPGRSAGRFSFPGTRWSWKILILKKGTLEAAGHSPNHAGLATRKVCQNDEFLDILRQPLTTPWPSHISAGPLDGDSAYFAAFFAVEPWIA